MRSTLVERAKGFLSCFDDLGAKPRQGLFIRGANPGEGTNRKLDELRVARLEVGIPQIVRIVHQEEDTAARHHPPVVASPGPGTPPQLSARDLW